MRTRPCQRRPCASSIPLTCRECRDDEVGEIWAHGPGVTGGYWRRPEENEETFAGRLADSPDARRYLRTGDLGFLRQGELFITGRWKDLVIIRGANHYPQDIEWTIEQSHEAFRPGCGGAFSLETDEGECLVVVYELEREHLQDDRARGTAARRAAGRGRGARPAHPHARAAQDRHGAANDQRQDSAPPVPRRLPSRRALRGVAVGRRRRGAGHGGRRAAAAPPRRRRRTDVHACRRAPGDGGTADRLAARLRVGAAQLAPDGRAPQPRPPRHPRFRQSRRARPPGASRAGRLRLQPCRLSAGHPADRRHRSDARDDDDRAELAGDLADCCIMRRPRSATSWCRGWPAGANSWRLP